MKQSKKAFSLIIAMMIVLVTTLLSFTVLEFVMPFSKNIKGVENAVNAYYYANSGVERALYFFKTREGEKLGEETSDTIQPEIVERMKYTYSTNSAGKILPPSTEGTSEHNRDYNTIATGAPIQIAVGNNLVKNIDKLEVQFQVPTIEGVPGELEEKKDKNKNEVGYILWQIVSPNGALYAQGNFVNKKGVLEPNTLISREQINGNPDPIKISELSGISYDTTGNEVRNIPLRDLFAGSGTMTTNNVNKLNCGDSATKCLLTFSVVQDLKTTNSKILPFLEWKITYEGSNPIPLRYSTIYSDGEYLGFGRSMEVRYPQETANEAASIAVLQ